jgi:LuxR family transcriptional regulator, maltose regulon positive regulatory protein
MTRLAAFPTAPHLFGEVLRERLIRGVSAEFVANLHSRASTWFEQYGFIHEAVQHALLAYDWDAAARLIEQVGLGFALSGKLVTVLGWFQALPEALVRTRPILCIANAVALFFTNQGSAARPGCRMLNSRRRQHCQSTRLRCW